MAQFAGELPVDTLREALPYLRRPFTEGAVRFKVQSAWTGQNAGALLVTYIDARLVDDRLNMVVADAWEDDYQDRPDGKSVNCLLTVMGTTRQDVGEATGGIALQKALRSDALKRAAVKFGIGVSIYAVPQIILNPNDGLRAIKVFNPRTKQKDKDSWALAEKGEQTCRKRYAKWLADKGVPVFGQPLDHGDVGDSQGDVDVEANQQQADEEGAGDELVARFLKPDELAKLKARAKELDRDFEVLMGAVGAEAEGVLTNIHAFEIWDLLGEAPKPAAKAPRRRRTST